MVYQGCGDKLVISKFLKLNHVGAISQVTTGPTYARLGPILRQIINVYHKAQYFIFIVFCILLKIRTLWSIHYECLKVMLAKFEIHRHCYWYTDPVLCLMSYITTDYMMFSPTLHQIRSYFTPDLFHFVIL